MLEFLKRRFFTNDTGMHVLDSDYAVAYSLLIISAFALRTAGVCPRYESFVFVVIILGICALHSNIDDKAKALQRYGETAVQPVSGLAASLRPKDNDNALPMSTNMQYRKPTKMETAPVDELPNAQEQPLVLDINRFKATEVNKKRLTYTMRSLDNEYQSTASRVRLLDSMYEELDSTNTRDPALRPQTNPEQCQPMRGQLLPIRNW